jgi:hypothetical protein
MNYQYEDGNGEWPDDVELQMVTYYVGYK